MPEAYRSYEYWRPRGTGWLSRGLGAVDGIFNRVYGSRYNPLYRTGTLAALFLTVALATGVYLLFVYEIGRPYDSMVAIQRDVWLGRWIRALHRYASDAAVVAVVLHVVRLVVQGKTWGARALAWITGVLLTAMMLVSAVTGFVLVWDEFGQAMAVAGAKMLRLLPLFPEPPDRAFVGDRPVPAQFFFMNLFLHVAVPLGMIALLWLHTSKLARAAWFPERKVAWGALLGLTALSVAWPAPLPARADLLAIPGRMAADWFYGFWIPLARTSPLPALLTTALTGVVLVVVPWLARPRRPGRPGPAIVDPDKCEGCQQCFADCPYDAIEMVAGKHPERHPLRAQVSPDLCVACGLCAGSCSSLAIGPEARTAFHQLVSARALVAGAPDARKQTLVIACRNDGDVAGRLRARAAAGGVATFEVDCAGTLHPGTVSYLASQFGRTLIVACPPQNCVHREGAALAQARILDGRRPAVAGRIAQQDVRLLNASPAEWATVRSAIDGTARSLPSRVAGAAASVAFSAGLLSLLALGSRAPQGTAADHAMLRLGWRLAGQTREICRELTPEEQAKQPVHMRAARECTSEVLTYQLKALVDERVMVDKTVRSPGLRADRPLSVEEEVAVPAGAHQVRVSFVPVDAASGGRSLRLERQLTFERGRVVLVTEEQGTLAVR